MKVKSDKLKVKSSGQVHTELETVKGMLARALADYDNLSKRVDREREDLGKIASIAVIIKLLPVLDNLERAQVHLQDSGLAIAIGEFINVLKDEGLSVINPSIGDEFNEQEMEALEVVPGERDNTITEVVLAGWKYSDGTVVRHAKVKVSKTNMLDKNKKLNKKEELIVENLDTHEEFSATQVDVDQTGDGERVLYRITTNFGSPFYKGIFVSRTRISVDANKGIDKTEIFDDGWNIIENALLSGDKKNVEYVFKSDGTSIRELDNEGGYK